MTNRLSRTVLIAGALLALSVLPVFANGQLESHRLSGMITGIQPATTSSNMVTVVLHNRDGNVTVTVDKAVLTALPLKVGQEVNIDGVLYVGQDGTKAIDPTDMAAGGKTVQVPPGETMVPEQAMAQFNGQHHGEQTQSEHQAPEHPESSSGTGSPGDR